MSQPFSPPNFPERDRQTELAFDPAEEAILYSEDELTQVTFDLTPDKTTRLVFRSSDDRLAADDKLEVELIAQDPPAGSFPFSVGQPAKEHEANPNDRTHTEIEDIGLVEAVYIITATGEMALVDSTELRLMFRLTFTSSKLNKPRVTYVVVNVDCPETQFGH